MIRSLTDRSSVREHFDYSNDTYPGLFGPEGLKFPGLMRVAVSGFMSRGLCGPTDDMDILLLSRLNPETTNDRNVRTTAGYHVQEIVEHRCKST